MLTDDMDSEASSFDFLSGILEGQKADKFDTRSPWIPSEVKATKPSARQTMAEVLLQEELDVHHQDLRPAGPSHQVRQQAPRQGVQLEPRLAPQARPLPVLYYRPPYQVLLYPQSPLQPRVFQGPLYHPYFRPLTPYNQVLNQQPFYRPPLGEPLLLEPRFHQQLQYAQLLNFQPWCNPALIPQYLNLLPLPEQSTDKRLLLQEQLLRNSKEQLQPSGKLYPRVPIPLYPQQPPFLQGSDEQLLTYKQWSQRVEQMQEPMDLSPKKTLKTAGYRGQNQDAVQPALPRASPEPVFGKTAAVPSFRIDAKASSRLRSSITSQMSGMCK